MEIFDGDSRTDDPDLQEHFDDEIDLEIPTKDMQNAYNRQIIQWEVGNKTSNVAMILENWMTLMKESNMLVYLEENFSASAHGQNTRKRFEAQHHQVFSTEGQERSSPW